ncbi:uncharacterized protein DDB_G0286299-like isoform X2 [Clytia hemisphaerica]|uniref:uncharacterized protein DDB_G0286299-like isoform X2 n=1 Tax=Clytia hemisphaerica TaxID=252671 RepID=UPI0034D49550
MLHYFHLIALDGHLQKQEPTSWHFFIELIIQSFETENKKGLLQLLNQVDKLNFQNKDKRNLQLFLNTKVLLCYYEQGNIKKARQFLRNNDILHVQEISNLLQQTDSTYPDGLDVKNLQAFIHPVIEELLQKVGKPKLYSQASALLSENEKTLKTQETQTEENRPKDLPLSKSKSALDLVKPHKEANPTKSSSSFVMSQTGKILMSPSIASCAKISISDPALTPFKKNLWSKDQPDDVKDNKRPKSPRRSPRKTRSSDIEKTVNFKLKLSLRSQKKNKPETTSETNRLSTKKAHKPQLEFTSNNKKRKTQKSLEADIAFETENILPADDEESPDLFAKLQTSTQNVESNELHSSNNSDLLGDKRLTNSISPIPTSYTYVTTLSQEQEEAIAAATKTTNTNKLLFRTAKAKDKEKEKDENSSSSRKRLFDVTPEEKSSKKKSIPPPGARRRRKDVTSNDGDEDSGESITWESPENDSETQRTKAARQMCKRNNTSINTKRRGRVSFTKKEEENLLEGVKKYGFGCWAKILKNYHFNPCRTSVSLKDKYRTLQNQGKV